MATNVERIIRRHGLVAHVRGNGPAMLLVHGLGSARHVWRPIVSELSKRYTTVSVDLLGHGDSTWPNAAPRDFSPAQHGDALVPLIEEFGPMHIVGNSMGGWIGLELAADKHAASLTALCPAGLEFDPWVSRSDILVERRLLARMLGPTLPPITKLVARTPIARDLLLRDATADFDSLDLELLADAATAMSQARGFFPSHDGMLHVLFSRPDEIPAEVAVSVVWGNRDVLLPAEKQRRVAAPAHAKWIVLDDCAHVPMWDQPTRTVSIIDQTVQRSLTA